MNLLAKLEDAMEAARRGEHAHALREYRWLHEHALEHDPAFCGVRVSFALAAWVELGETYPPAREALVEIRDAKSHELLRGGAGREAFEDVEAIDSHLGDHRATYELFRRLREVQPGVAESCADLAWETAAAFDDFALARACIHDPPTQVRAWTEELNEDVSFIRVEMPGPPPQLEDATVETFARRVALLLSVLASVGEGARAAALRADVLGAIEEPSVREQVRDLLAPGA